MVLSKTHIKMEPPPLQDTICHDYVFFLPVILVSIVPPRVVTVAGRSWPSPRFHLSHHLVLLHGGCVNSGLDLEVIQSVWHHDEFAGNLQDRERENNQQLI